LATGSFPLAVALAEGFGDRQMSFSRLSIGESVNQNPPIDSMFAAFTTFMNTGKRCV